MSALTRRSLLGLGVGLVSVGAGAKVATDTTAIRNRFIRDFLEGTYAIGALTCIEYMPDDPERTKDVMYQTFINAMQDFKDNGWVSNYFIKCFLQDREWQLPIDALVVEITWEGPRGEPGGVYSA